MLDRMPRRRKKVDLGKPTWQAPPRKPYKYAVERIPRTKLDRDTVEEFCKMVADGMPFTAVCDYIGINDTTFQAWRRKGELILQGHDIVADEDECALYAMFVLGMKKASAEVIMRLAKQAQRSRQWYRAFRLLQTLDKANYGHDPQGGSDAVMDPNEKFV